jgi:hypothetical protein
VRVGRSQITKGLVRHVRKFEFQPEDGEKYSKPLLEHYRWFHSQHCLPWVPSYMNLHVSPTTYSQMQFTLATCLPLRAFLYPSTLPAQIPLQIGSNFTISGKSTYLARLPPHPSLFNWSQSKDEGVSQGTFYSPGPYLSLFWLKNSGILHYDNPRHISVAYNNVIASISWR